MGRIHLYSIVGLMLLSCVVKSQKWDQLLWTSTQPNERDLHSVSSFKLDKKLVLCTIFGGLDDTIPTMYNDVWGFTLDFKDSANNAWAVLHDGTGSGVPSPRYGHQTAVIETDSDITTLSFLTFGGFGGSTYYTSVLLEDTWIFTVDSTTSSWLKMNTTQAPTARYQYAMVPLVVNSISGSSERFSGAGIMGGSNLSYPLNDFWVFSTENNDWFPVDFGPSFEPRWGHSAVVYSGDIFVFGGFDATTYYNDVWKLSLTDGTWSKIHDGTAVPSPMGRYNHNAASASGGFIVFGGYLQNTSISNELWFFDVGSKKWTDLTEESMIQSNQTLPPARFGAAAQGVAELDVSGRDSTLVVFAGRNETNVFDDVWYMNIPKVGSDNRDVVGPSIAGAFMIIGFVAIPMGLSVFYAKQ